MVARSEAGPSSATMSTPVTLPSWASTLRQNRIFAASPSDAIDTPHASAGLHVQPHGAHMHGAGTVGDEDDEHDYESLPVGAGLWVNMAAGAMVSVVPVSDGIERVYEGIADAEPKSDEAARPCVDQQRIWRGRDRDRSWS